jgi:hypothetical protein
MSTERWTWYGIALLTLLTGAGCGGLNIAPGMLPCGKNGECPSGFVCGAGDRCWDRGHGDAAADADAGRRDPDGADADLAISEGGTGDTDGSGPSEAGGGSCTALDNPTGGLVDIPALIAGSLAAYSCDIGWQISGAPTRTCQSDGTWSGSAPTCAIKDCGPLTAPKDGSVSAPTTTYGSTATYSCAAGFGPSGSSTRTCQLDGTWDGMQPTCVVANCPALQGPTGGSVSAPTLTYGSTGSYLCDVGYIINGLMSRMCQSNGQWSGTQPTCDPKDCGAPGKPLHGSVVAATTTNTSRANYMCDSGYTLSGSSTRTCQSDQMWSGSVPSCLPNDCGAPGAIAFGMVSYSATSFGSSAIYSCTTNYTISGGSASVTCQANGQWTVKPSCADICTVVGMVGTASHCCTPAACPTSTPVCNASRVCVAQSLGNPCSAGQCGSNTCVSGVCCENACNNACDKKTCDVNGKCQHKDFRTSCQTKTGSEPSLNNIEFYCDQQGQCVAPKISCNGSATLCDLTTKACCQSAPSTSFALSCVSPSSCCDGTASTCGGGTDQRWYGCKSTLDCPLGLICAVHTNFLGDYGIQYSECLPGLDSSTWTDEACDPGLSSSQCVTANTCTDFHGGEIGGGCI